MDTVPRKEFPWMTWIIILVCSTVFLIEMSLPEQQLKAAVEMFGIVPAHFDGSKVLSFPAIDYLSLFTSILIHGGWLHIIGNMWFLYLFGGSLEEHIGHFKFLIFYLFCGILSGVTYIYLNLHSSEPSIGASGAVAGIMGAYILMFPRARVLTLVPVIFIPFFFYLPAYFFLGVWFLIQLISETYAFLSVGYGTSAGGVAWSAHVGGFLSGMVLIFVFRKKERRPVQPDELHHYIR
jgi:membrane associated rhomboid family serine protease